MSFQHDILAATQAFNANLHMLAQQQSSILEDTVRVESLATKSEFFDRSGTAEVVAMTSRHQDTPFTPVPYSRRRLDVVDFGMSELIDDKDMIKMLVNPQSSITETFAASFKRNKDRVIINGLLGNAFAADADFGISSVVLANGSNNIAVGTSNLPTLKLKDALLLLEKADVDITVDQPYLAITPSQYRSLLADPEFTNRDYRLIENMMGGVKDIKDILGIKLKIVSPTLLPKVGNTRTCILYTKSACRLGINADYKTKIAEDPTKAFSLRVFSSHSIGAVRMEEARVVSINCDESVV
jgi:hypothetical protein